MLLTAADGIELRAAVWAQNAPRGTVLLCHGRSEFIEKYYPVIARLNGLGFGVFTFDWRGQGLSQRLLDSRLPGYVDHFDSYQRDLDAAMAEVTRLGLADNLYLMAHSMGGCNATRRLSESDAFNAAILSAPMLGLHFSWLKLLGIRALGGLAKLRGKGEDYVQACDDRTVGDWGFKDNVLTHSEEEFARYAGLIEAYPDLGLGGVTWSWLNAAMRQIDALSNLPENSVTTATLVFTAAEDTVVSNEAIEAFAAKNEAMVHHRLENSRHEALIETPDVQAAFWARAEAFLMEQAPMV